MHKVVSLFAGCGGSSLGYKLAGCHVLAAVERDPHAIEIYQANSSSTKIFNQDITNISPLVMMSELGLIPGELDILDGSPPCQGFSTAGKRLISDPRNNLFVEYVRFLNAFKPKAFVMENVTGLVKGHMQKIFQEMIFQLKNEGYTVQAKILNAAYYGVPQARQRVIILGIRSDLGLTPNHPHPYSQPITFRQAVANLGKIGPTVVPTGRALKMAQALKPGESGAKMHKNYQQKGDDFSLIRLHWDKPSPTVCKTIRVGQCGLLHPSEHRFLSINELKRICSFPDEFNLFGSFEQQWARLGNAVPPLMMKAIATTLTDQLKGIR